MEPDNSAASDLAWLKTSVWVCLENTGDRYLDSKSASGRPKTSHLLDQTPGAAHWGLLHDLMSVCRCVVLARLQMRPHRLKIGLG